jgi:hypothetical protein
MADITPRICWQNWAQLTNAVVSVSSENTSYPKEWAKNVLRTKTWRSATGWTIVTGFNDKLDFTEGSTGDATATLDAATYTSGGELATEIQTQINASATDNTYTVTYSSSTYKFTIERATGTDTIGLEWATGSNTATSCGEDLGFDVSADDTGATTYTSDTVSYQSRHWIKFDLAAAKDVGIAILHYFNIDTTNGAVQLQGNATDVWTAPSLDDAMAGTDIWVKWYSADESYRYWRFVINDTQNSNGFVYLGIPYLGEFYTPDPGLAARFAEEYEELSEVGFADSGAPFQHEKLRARKYRLVWPGMSTTEKNYMKNAAAFLRLGRPFFFFLDPQNDTDGGVYVINIKPVVIQHLPPNKWQVTMQVEEALG